MKYSAPLTQPPAGLAQYVADNPTSRDWKSFRNEFTDAYKELANALELRQRGLCAFCEIQLKNTKGISDRQVEHWHPKEDSSGPINWTFEISNLQAACTGRSQAHWFAEDPDRSANPPPGPNHSCGQAKGNVRPDTISITSRPYRPSELPIAPSLFIVSPDGGIAPSSANCANGGYSEVRVGATIALLNLDCPRLRNARKAIYDYLDGQLASYLAQYVDTEAALTALAQDLINLDSDARLPAFITTFRSYFGAIAEQVLGAIPDWAAAP